jgi:prevent-host-death family protein
MKTVNVHEAKTQLSRLLQRVAGGEEITIANRGTPVARLVPAERPKGRRVLGIDRGHVKIADDFDEPLPPEILAGFLGDEGRAGNESAPKRKRK